MTSMAEAIRLDGRRALVTGAAGGIGRAVSKALGDVGAELILLDRNETALKTEADALSESGIDSEILACDLADETSRSGVISRLSSSGINVIVNGAAYVGASALPGWATDFQNQQLGSWREAIEVNLTAAFHLVQGLYPTLRASAGASVVNIGSIYGSLGPDWRLYAGTDMANPAAYAASKGGLHQLTRWLATTLAPDVRVNAVAPGGILRGQPSAFIDRYTDRTPMRRMGTEADMCGAIVFLASDMSSYITGQVLSVDGGWSAW